MIELKAGRELRVAGGRSVAQPGWSQDELSMPRAKPRSLVISVTYRLTRLARLILGRERLLRAQLFAAWLFHRLAQESAVAVYGDSFRSVAFGLSADDFEDWIPENATVLDLGCGVGCWSRLVAPRARKVVGLDYDRRSIERARAETVAPNTEFILGDLTRPLDRLLSGRSFDIVLLLHVIEHVDDADGLLRSLHEIARTLIVEVPDFEANPLNRVRWALGAPFYSDADHVREYTAEILREQLLRTGWEVEDLRQRGSVLVALARPTALAAD